MVLVPLPLMVIARRKHNLPSFSTAGATSENNVEGEVENESWKCLIRLEKTKGRAVLKLCIHQKLGNRLIQGLSDICS